MKMFAKIEIDDSKFNELVEAYEKARDELSSYLWKSRLKAKISEEEAASGN